MDGVKMKIIDTLEFGILNESYSYCVWNIWLQAIYFFPFNLDCPIIPSHRSRSYQIKSFWARMSYGWTIEHSNYLPNIRKAHTSCNKMYITNIWCHVIYTSWHRYRKSVVFSHSKCFGNMTIYHICCLLQPKKVIRNITHW